MLVRRAERGDEELAHDDPALALELEVDLEALAMYDLGVNRNPFRFGRIDETLAADSPVARRALCHAAFRRTWRSEDAAHAAALAERGLADGLLLSERGTETPDLSSAALTLIYADRLESARGLVDTALRQAHAARVSALHMSRGLRPSSPTARDRSRTLRRMPEFASP